MSSLLRTSRPTVALQTLAFLVVFAVGTVARVYVMARFEPASGDGPLRAAMAEWWVEGLRQHDTTYVEYAHAGWEYMRLRLTGPWPPGHTVLAGLLIFVFGDPVFSTSLLSLLLGISSIYLIYYVATQAFGPPVGLLSAATLALLPLHITLSTNPLTEVPAAFFVLSILALLSRGMEVGFSTLLLVILCFLTFIGTMIRYELWLLLPTISGAYWYVRRSVWRACIVTVASCLGPLIWMFSAWIHHGSPFASFGGALPDGGEAGVIPAIALTVEKLSAAVGYFMVVAAALGTTFIVIDFDLTLKSAKKIVYVSAALMQLAFLVWFASRRGESLWDRYVLITSVMIAPLTTHEMSVYRSLIKRCFVGAAIIGSMLLSFYIHHGSIYIRAKVPDEVSEAAAWLDRRLGPEETFITTRLQGDAHTIDLRTRRMPYNVAYANHSAEELQAVWEAVQPSYVVVLAGEDPGDRLLEQFSSQIELSEPAERFGEISIYRVRHDDGA